VHPTHHPSWYALTDADGLIIEEGIAMTNNGIGWGGFDFTVDYDVDRRQVGTLIVWVDSALDGSQIDVRVSSSAQSLNGHRPRNRLGRPGRRCPPVI